MEYTKTQLLAHGWSANIYLARDEYGNEVLIKEVRDKSPRKNLAEREGKMLSLANTVNVGPKIIEIDYKNNRVVREYVHGEEFREWVLGKTFGTVTREQLYAFIKELYRQLLRLDTIHVSHNQLGVGKNVLVKKETNTMTGSERFVPVIIDYEKATVKPGTHTKNIGQIEDLVFYNPNGVIAKKVREKMSVIL